MRSVALPSLFLCQSARHVPFPSFTFCPGPVPLDPDSTAHLHSGHSFRDSCHIQLVTFVLHWAKAIIFTWLEPKHPL